MELEDCDSDETASRMPLLGLLESNRLGWPKLYPTAH
jgi:hypothetical protein